MRAIARAHQKRNLADFEKALKDYQQQKKAGLDPQFDPRKVGIRNAEFWELRADGLVEQGMTGEALAARAGGSDAGVADTGAAPRRDGGSHSA